MDLDRGKTFPFCFFCKAFAFSLHFAAFFPSDTGLLDCVQRSALLNEQNTLCSVQSVLLDKSYLHIRPA